ncbi:ABC-type molybdate transport system permease subunit [Microbacterium natoriense]|uniref:ABC-type molybdate transport system permease subunit n=2 Tax=Microbacterium natoriense TaxID=284570 RepID=A0AAW8EXQ1_9MICO|nr:PLDc N-terminal domain-containing protein [Microbacterium sp.]MDQ0648111.1 ABC-type molybdate transport system permease subunit [Microbacterium natoriense]
MMNPLIPTAYDVVWSVVTAAVLAFTIAAIISMMRTRHVGGLRFLVWFLLVLAAPVLGAAAWFAYGRRAEATRP